MTLAAQPAYLEEENIYYPNTDGKPMADSDSQRKPLTYLVEALDYYFRKKRHVYVSGDMLIYYQKGNPRLSVAPDVFVAFGVPKHERDIYQTWLEGKAPDVVIEITYRKDENEKPKLYQNLGIREYFQYDPTGDYLQPALRGRRLDEKGSYQDMTVAQLEEGAISLTSESLKLELRLENDRLRVFDPKTKKYLFSYSEAMDFSQEEAKARQKAEKKARIERKKKEWAQLEASIEREQKELAQLEAEQERQRAEKLADKLRALGINPNEQLALNTKTTKLKPVKK
jgi:23S rRNA pseudoU1915 N3-methylase RlmH